MDAVLDKDVIDDATINIIDKKLLEAEELEARGGKYYTQEEMDKFFSKYEK